MVALFLDGRYELMTEFYTKARDDQILCEERFVNSLMLYSLTPGVTSSFRDVRLCTGVCPDT